MKSLLVVLLAVTGCSSTTNITNVIVGDDSGSPDAVAIDGGGVDAAMGDTMGDAETGDAGDAAMCPALVPVEAGTSKTTTPIGTGKPSFCDPDCGAAPFGYTVTGAAPDDVPGVPGCSRLGATTEFCCTAARCTRDSAKDSLCVGAPLLRNFNWTCETTSPRPTMPSDGCQDAGLGVGSGTNFNCCDAP